MAKTRHSGRMFGRKTARKRPKRKRNATELGLTRPNLYWHKTLVYRILDRLILDSTLTFSTRVRLRAFDPRAWPAANHDGQSWWRTAGCDALASVEAFGTGYSALTRDDPCASLREIICEIDMAAAGAGGRYHSHDCQNPWHDVAVHGRIRVQPPLTKRNPTA